MKFKVASDLLYRVTEPTTLLLNLEAARFGRQRVIDEKLDLPAAARVDEFEMPQERSRITRITLEAGDLPISYRAEVELSPFIGDADKIGEIAIEHLPLHVTSYLLQSRYCQSDKLARFAEEEFGSIEPGWRRVQAICNWIYEHVEYRSGSSDGLTTAVDTLVAHEGVCRDFAHLGIALCRALLIPARFVSSYAWQLQPPDFHAVFEAYLGDRWWVFDATRKASVDGIVRIGSGRDAADAAFATIFGEAELVEMAVSIEALNGDVDREPTIVPISLADAI